LHPGVVAGGRSRHSHHPAHDQSWIRDWRARRAWAHPDPRPQRGLVGCHVPRPRRVGFQARVEILHVVLVFRTRHSLDRILSGKGKLTLGADAAIAAGPIGRQAEAGTDARLQAEIWSYSRSRGLFAGVALDGAALLYDRRANAEYLRDQSPVVAQRTLHLLARLTELSSPVSGPGAAQIQAPFRVL